jgi:anti-sigma B factor antagonist
MSTCGDPLELPPEGPETRPRLSPWRTGGDAVLSERYPVLWVGQAAVISAPVEVDVTNAEDVCRCLLAAIGSGARMLVADMTATTFCDCAGVFAIVACWKRAAAEGVSLRLVVGAAAVKHVFAVTGASVLIDIRPTVADALIGPG